MLSLSVEQDLLAGRPTTVPPVSTAATPGRGIVSNAPGPSPGRLNLSLQLLEAQSHSIRLEIQAKEQEDKATPKTYARHYNSYETWWNAFQVAETAQKRHLVALPAMPIIPSKVVMFLQYETTREKVFIYHPALPHVVLINRPSEEAWNDRNNCGIVGREVPGLPGHLRP
ncbi:hypothetical protein B0H11DRAFT_1728346 [Mycena galericulata]|nr:hypothetical protein B0H11DRAFT_1728346 [Mycena galericulata]